VVRFAIEGGGMHEKEDMTMNTQNMIDIYEEFEAESVSF